MKRDFFPILRGNLFLVLGTSKNFSNNLKSSSLVKIATVISKKKEKKAVKRNKVKRLIEESFHKLEGSKRLKGNNLTHLIFLPNTKIFDSKYQDIFQEMKKIFN